MSSSVISSLSGSFFSISVKSSGYNSYLGFTGDSYCVSPVAGFGFLPLFGFANGSCCVPSVVGFGLLFFVVFVVFAGGSCPKGYTATRSVVPPSET